MSTVESLAQQSGTRTQGKIVLQLLKLDTTPGLREDGSPKGYCVFGQQPDDGGHLPRPKFTLNPDDWRDYGCPTSITVTIEPGDHLNV